MDTGQDADTFFIEVDLQCNSTGDSCNQLPCTAIPIVVYGVAD